MEKLIKIIRSPSTPGLEVVGNIVIKLFVPCSENDVTIQVNPNIQDYQENADKPGIQVRQLIETKNTDQTKTLKLDFQENNIQKIKIDDEEYKIRLMSIGKEELEGQKFPYFEFLVRW